MKEKNKLIRIIIITAIIILIIGGGIFYLNQQNKEEICIEKIGESETQLDINSEIVKELRDKIKLNQEVLSNIYKQEEIDTATISNELVLLLGWNNLELNQNSNEVTLNEETGKGSVTVTKEKMEESIKSIFGNNIKYVDESFENMFIEPYFYCDGTQGTVTFKDGTYTTEYIEGGGAGYPEINEEIEKVLKYSDYIEIYVKTSFFSYEESKYFSDFNLENEVLNISNEENIDREVLNQNLNSYVYTFKLDNKTNEYYFDSFKPVNINQ